MDEEEKFAACSCEDFTKKLAAKTPVPGGGGAAALAGALAVSLCSMTAGFTKGKKKYARYEADIERILIETDNIRRQLLKLIDEDAESFKPLSQAYAMPKDDPDRAKVIEEASLKACEAPLAMMAEICHAISLTAEAAEKGSTLMISDTACAVYLGAAALQAASLNVFINTRELGSSSQAREIEEKAHQMLDEFLPLATKTAQEAAEKVMGEEK